MLHLRANDIPNQEKYEEYIREDQKVYIDPSKVEARYLYSLELQNTKERHFYERMILDSGNMFITTRDRDVKHYFTEVLRVRGLVNYKTKKTSLAKDIVDRVYMYTSRPEHREPLALYRDWNSSVSRNNNLRSIFNRHSVPTNLINEKGKSLKAINFRYTRRATGRYYTRDYNVQAIPLEYIDMMTVPKDRALLWFDFDQIDFRILYYTFLAGANEEDDKTFQQYDDKYEAIARIITRHNGDTFNREKFLEQRDHYKVGALARAYGAGPSTLAAQIPDERFVNQLDRFFRGNAKYQRYVNDLERVIETFPEMTLTDYFGVTRELTTDPTFGDSPLKQGLNTPVQSTTNSIIMHVVNKIMDTFNRLGLGDKVGVYLVRHDEPVFWVDKEALEHAWVFDHYSTVLVDGWSPLTSNIGIGYYYGEEDKALRKYFDSKVLDATSKVSSLTEEDYQGGGEYNYDYEPVKIVHDIYSGVVGSKGYTYDQRNDIMYVGPNTSLTERACWDDLNRRDAYLAVMYNAEDVGLIFFEDGRGYIEHVRRWEHPGVQNAHVLAERVIEGGYAGCKVVKVDG